MKQMTSPLGYPFLSAREDFARVREVFDRVGFTDEGVREALRSQDLLDIRDKDLDRLLRGRDQRGPLATLIRLFLLGSWVDLHAVEAALERAFPLPVPPTVRERNAGGRGLAEGPPR